jgi:hypothetical protein
MSTIDIYDPAQCCATGACGPDADDELAQFASALEGLKQSGVAVSRYNLGHQPGAFVQNALVKDTIQKEGIGCLPLVIADGRIVSKGRYPTRDELRAQAGVAAAAAPKAASCCGPAKAATTTDTTVAAQGKPCCG